MSPGELISWLYALYVSLVKNFAFVHGNSFIFVSMVFQGFIGWGLFATALYRVYVINIGTRNFAEEFASYGLPKPDLMVILVCIMEFGVAVIFTAGIIFSDLIFLTSLAFAFLMVLAVLARVQGKEPFHKMIPATTFGLVALGCALIDQSADVSDSMLSTLISVEGRAGLTACVIGGDLVTIGITLYKYCRFKKEVPKHEGSLHVHLIRRHSSQLLEVVV